MKRMKIAALFLAMSISMIACGTESTIKDNTESQTQDNQSSDNTQGSQNSDSAEESTLSESDEKDQKKENESQESEVQKDVSSQSQVQITEETQGDSVTAQDSTVVQDYSYTIPIITITGNEQATKAIQADVEKEKEIFLKSARENGQIAKEYYEGITDEAEKESFCSYADYLSYYIGYQNEKIISVVFSNYGYTGGAHGGGLQTTANYSLETGERITFDSFFADKESAMADIKTQVLKQCESPYYSNLLFPEYKEYLDDVLVEDYWYFSKSGMRFICNEYTLGPYASGCFDFVIPYEDVPETKQEFVTQNVYLYPIPYGSTIEEDLDGDGHQEKICYNIISPEPETEIDEEGEEYQVYGEDTCSLTIDGVEYTDSLNQQAEYSVEIPYSHYYLVDLDETDSYVELALVDQGYNDYTTTIFLRYDKGELTYLGNIHDTLESESCQLFGKGKLSAREHSNLLETTNFIYDYQLVDGKIQPQLKEWYTFDNEGFSEEYRTHKILKNVNVYTENNTGSETKTLTPQDGFVTFEESDNKEWVKLKTEDGGIYYLHMNTMTEIDSAGVEEDAMEVFENLFLAG